MDKMKDKLLSIKNLNIEYGKKPVLNGINLSFEGGKLYGVLGPNGAGKSTLLKAVTHQLKVDKSTIFIEGKDLTTIKTEELALKVSAMSQSFSMKFPYSVTEIVAMGRYPYSGGHLTKEDHAAVEKAIAEADLQEIRDRSVNALSGGEKQRVLLGKTLCQDTEIILIDEGFSSMDIYYQIQFIKLLKNKVKEENKLIIFIMHDLVLARKYCDEILLLKEGRAYDFGESSSVLNEKALMEVFKVKGSFVGNALDLD